MQPRFPLLLSALLGIAFTLAACSTTESATADDATEWLLAPDAHSTRGAYLSVGISPDEVRDQLGKGARVLRPKKYNGAVEIWEYQREMAGPNKYGIQNSGSNSRTIRQSNRFLEIVTIRFEDGKVVAVKTLRRSEFKDALNPPFGPNAK